MMYYEITNGYWCHHREGGGIGNAYTYIMVTSQQMLITARPLHISVHTFPIPPPSLLSTVWCHSIL